MDVIVGGLYGSEGKGNIDRAANARLVVDTIERTHTAQAAKAASRSDFVKGRAGAVKKAAEEAAKARQRPRRQRKRDLQRQSG